MADLQSAISSLEKENNFTFKDFQRQALLSFASGHDVFICVPTGQEKTACYSFISRLWIKMNFSNPFLLLSLSSFRPSLP